MGQYHIPVNVTKREYIHPHRVGDGLKCLEQVGSAGGTVDAVALLLMSSCKGGRRGGGDVDHAIAGRWAGDIVFWIGDYNEPEDFKRPGMRSYAKTDLYSEVRYSDGRDLDEEEASLLADIANGEYVAMRRRELVALRNVRKKPWLNISDLVIPMLEDACAVTIGRGDGWVDRRSNDTGEANRLMRPDMVITVKP